MEPGAQTQYRADLVPLPTPWYKTWWAWTVIGTAVAATTATAVVLALAFLFPHEPLFAFSAGIIALVVLTTTTPGETESWFLSSWDFA